MYLRTIPNLKKSDCNSELWMGYEWSLLEEQQQQGIVWGHGVFLEKSGSLYPSEGGNQASWDFG